MKHLITLTALMIGICQPTRILAQAFDLGGSTYAIVIGISDYQDDEIPDLRFADKDAEAFANFLRSPAGGSLDDDQLTLLTNQAATAGKMAEALDAAIEKAKEGDQVIIYFSGHGDVEGKKISQPGFLLCWDAPSRVYMGGGTYSLSFLQEVVSTLSLQNLSKVTVITDACHAGKLAGSQIGGAQLTSANLATQYANEVKILSCQPNEYSIEGEQWGGGRGAFSYNLLDALYGMADGNADNSITLQEVGRYLEDHVPPEVAPVSQIPMVMGRRNEQLAIVDEHILAELRAGKANQLAMISSIETRGFEDDVLAMVGQDVRELYFSFKKALKDKVFFNSWGREFSDYADAYFEQLMAEPKLAPLYSTMRRNYAAALQDDAQQVMNKWLKTDMSEVILTKITKADKYQAYPQHLEKAAELLGTGHYMYPILQAKAYFFRGYLLALSSQNPDVELGQKALAAFRTSLKWQAELPLVYWQMSNVFAYNLSLPDSAIYYAALAVEQNPTWIIPLTSIGFSLSSKYKMFDKAKSYLDQAMRLDSNSAIVWVNFGCNHYDKKEYRAAEKCYIKAIQLDSNYINAYNNLGNVYYKTNNYEAAERQYKKVIYFDSTYIDGYNNLGVICSKTERNPEAVQYFLKVIQLDASAVKTHKNLGGVYAEMQQYDLAEKALKKAVSLDPNYTNAYIDLADVYIQTHKMEEAEAVLKIAIQLDSTKSLAYANLSRVYFELKIYPAAESMILKSIDLNPKYVGFRSLLGIVYLKMNRLDDAARVFKEEQQLDPKYPELHFGLACLFAQKQQPEQAWAELEEALKNGFQDDEKLQSNPELTLLRKRQVQWNALMKKYFPSSR